MDCVPLFSGRCPVRVKPSILALCVSASLAFWSATPAASSTSGSSTGTTSSSAIAAVKIDNFGQVNDRYYRGAQPEGHDYADLAAIGVKTVIDLTLDGEAREAGLVKAA